MLTLVPKLKMWAAAAVGVVLALVGVFLRGRSAGKRTEQTKVLRDQVNKEIKRNETTQATNEVASDIGGLPVSDVRKRLQDRWTRD